MAPTGDGSDAPGMDAADRPVAPPRKLSIDYLLEGDSVRTNPHLRAFAASRLPEVLRADPNYRSWASIKSRCCARRSPRLPPPPTVSPAVAKARGLDLALGDPLGDGDGVVIFDPQRQGIHIHPPRASLPRARPHARQQQEDQPRALRSLHPRVTFHCIDLYAPEALELVRDAVALHGSRAAAVVGVHLCGDLARRAMQPWDESGSDALVLSPCCLVREVGEHKRPAGRFGYGLSRLARTSGWTRTACGVSFCFTTRGWRTEGRVSSRRRGGRGFEPRRTRKRRRRREG